MREMFLELLENEDNAKDTVFYDMYLTLICFVVAMVCYAWVSVEDAIFFLILSFKFEVGSMTSLVRHVVVKKMKDGKEGEDYACVPLKAGKDSIPCKDEDFY